LSCPDGEHAVPASPSTSPSILPLRLAAAEQAAQDRAGSRENSELRFDSASFSSTSTRSSAASIWSRSVRRLRLVLVAQLGDLLVGTFVGERRASGGELLRIVSPGRP
jgi:hypothetical protein